MSQVWVDFFICFPHNDGASISIQEPEKWPDLALEDIFGPAARPISSESPKDGGILEVYSYMEVSPATQPLLSWSMLELCLGKFLFF